MANAHARRRIAPAQISILELEVNTRRDEINAASGEICNEMSGVAICKQQGHIFVLFIYLFIVQQLLKVIEGLNLAATVGVSIMDAVWAVHENVFGVFKGNLGRLGWKIEQDIV